MVRPTTLAVDVGASAIKASVLDAAGRMIADRVRRPTPTNVTPGRLVGAVARVARSLPRFDRVSVGFPGVVRDGVVRTAPNLGTDAFRGFNLSRELRRRLGQPVRVINDADMHGLGAIRGQGVELVITLGTGFGMSIFLDGRLGPHLEMGHHPFRKGRTYEDELGERARRRLGGRKWNRRALEAIDRLRALTDFDHMYVGGGNAKRLDVRLPPGVSRVDNSAAILGGIRLWETGGLA